MSFSSENELNNNKVKTLSPQEQEKIKQTVHEILTKYDSQADKQTIEEFTPKFVKERNIEDVNSLLKVINKGFDTIDKITEYHQNLINAQEKGKSKASWLKTMIKTATNVQDVEKISKIVHEVQSTLAKSNNQHLASLLDEKAENVEVFKPTPEKKFEGINQQVIVQNLLGDTQNNSLLNIISTAQTIDSLSKKFDDFEGNVIEIAKDFFEGEFANNAEILVKKLVTAGVIVADAEYPIEILDGMDGSQIAMIVDMGLTIAKTSYKVAEGKMPINNAMEYIADRAIADIGVVIGTVAKLKIEYVATGMGAAVGSVFGPVGAVVGGFIGHGVGKVAGDYIAPQITEGAKKLSKVAKPTIKRVVQKTVEVFKEVRNTAKQFGKAIVNFLS